MNENDETQEETPQRKTELTRRQYRLRSTGVGEISTAPERETRDVSPRDIALEVSWAVRQVMGR